MQAYHQGELKRLQHTAPSSSFLPIIRDNAITITKHTLTLINHQIKIETNGTPTKHYYTVSR